MTTFIYFHNLVKVTLTHKTNVEIRQGIAHNLVKTKGHWALRNAHYYLNATKY